MRNSKGQFVAGRKESAEEKLRRIDGMRKAWRDREDYIGDIVSECPRIYSSWRAFRFTKKGKRQGNSPEWNNYRTFYNDVRPTYQEGFVLRRLDISKPFSKDNFIWLSVDDAIDLHEGRKVFLTYCGETMCLKDWADKLGVSLAAIKIRYYRHKDSYSVEEILFGKKKERNSKEAKDASESNIRSKASKMISSYKAKDKRNNFKEECDLTVEWLIENIIQQPCIYCGDTKRIGCDRIDNSKGHTKDNVVPCCIECNTARNNHFSYGEMKLLGKTIAEIKRNRK